MENVLLVVVLAVPAVILARWLCRRSALRAFANRRGLRFRGTIPSDNYPPYIFFAPVSQAGNQSLDDAAVRQLDAALWSQTRAEHAFVSAGRLAPNDIPPFVDGVVGLIQTA